MKGTQFLVLITAGIATLSGGCAGSRQSRYDAAMAKGQDLYEKREYSRAILEFRNAAQAMPGSAQAYYRLGLAAAAAGDVRTGFLSLQKATSLDPKHTDAQLRLAQMLVHGNQEHVKDAEERLKTAVQQGLKQSPEMLNTLAFTELRLGKVKDATAVLERALAESPGELTSAVLLSRTRLEQKDVKGAEDVLKAARDNAPASADAHRILGEFYMTQSRYPEARIELNRALEMDGKNPLTLLDLSRLALSSGRKEEAEVTFRRLTAFDGYHAAYARFLFEEGRRDEAVREFERLWKLTPDDRSARTDLVAAYLATDRVTDALRILEDAVRKSSKDGEALLQRSEILIRQGKLAQAETDVNQVRRLFTASPEVHYMSAKLHEAKGTFLTYRQELDEALRLNPLLQPVRVELARSLISRKEYRAAVQVLDAAPDMQKTSPEILVQRNWANWGLGDVAAMRKGIDQGLALQRSVEFLTQDALWKLRSGDTSGARTAIESALNVNPGDLNALQVLSETYGRMNAPAVALQKVKEYASRQPGSAPVQHLLGTLLIARGDVQAARTAFTAALTADPKFRAADLALVQVDVLDRRMADARKRLETILAGDSGNLTAVQWLASLQILAADWNGAIANLRKVSGLDPNNSEALNNLAYLLAEHDGQLDEALKYAEKAVELAPDNPAYCDTLGWILYRKRVYPSAIRYLERADRKNAVSQLHLAMAYLKGGQVQRGRTTFEAAVKLNPNVPEAKMARDVLAEQGR